MEQSTLDLLPFVKELDKHSAGVLPEIRLELTYQPGSYLVKADPPGCSRSSNLAVNARDASPTAACCASSWNGSR
jgi:hypothetical protein